MVSAFAGAAAAAEPFDAGPLQGFFDRHCYECHDGSVAEGGLDLAAIGGDLSDPVTFAIWERVHDRVESGEMPPAKKQRPPAGDREAFAAELARPLAAAHAAEKGTVLRRLNRREYENTVNDLLGVHLDLAELLPEDGRSHEFDNIGESLHLSMVQMHRYLEAADTALDAAVATTVEKPESRTVRASYADTRGAEKFLGKNWHLLDDGAVAFYQAWGYPTGMLREANVREPGFYRVRVTGYAHQSDRPVTFSIGATTFARGRERPTFSYHAMPPGEPTTVETEAWIDRNYMIEVTPYGIYDTEYAIKNHGIENYRGPGLAVLHVEVEGPVISEFPARGHRLLFDGLGRREAEPANPAEREKPWYRPRFEITGDGPEPALARFAERAFRRPVTPQDTAPYLGLFRAERDGGAGFEEALRTAAAAVLCAPDFLFLRERPGRLDGFELASRLSYFLTRTLPDRELLDAAAAGGLTAGPGPDALLHHADRLLDGPLGDRFVNDFTDAWLDLRNIRFTNPDAELFPEFDPFLEFSMLAETRGFFREILDGNHPAARLVDPGFAMLNSRLADHYGIEGVGGPELRKVDLPSGSPRGGLLAHASVLKVSANGNNTSPVVRGVWVMERLLGDPPQPPPPGTPGVEPDIRGGTTLREILDQHRSSQSCNACHRNIDPPGFALESFNPVGGWRDRFRSLGEGDQVDLRIGTRRARYRLGPPVDATGQLPDGRTFAGFLEFRDLLAADDRTLAKTLTTKLLTFATGREMGFSDRDEIDAILDRTAAGGYRARDLLHAVVQSEIFRSK